MTSFRFLHCSDLHIDSPFRGISSDQPKLAEKLRRSTLRAYQNIIQLALRERVDAVVIAGDIYDSEDKSLQAQLKFRQGLQELAEAGIPAFVAHGNHDPLNGWSATLDLPETVRIFPGGEVTRLPVKRGGKPVAHVYGISYAQKEVTDNLARKFQRDPGDEFAIGVLHANVGNNPDHLNYAPCSLADLVEAGMDYWALGHIHAHKVLRENQPAIVFSGNPQARFHREAGEKGCCLVTLHSHSPPEVQFVPVDEVRFVTETLDLSTVERVEEVIERLSTGCEDQLAAASGRSVVIRWTLTGRSPVHRELQNPGLLDDLKEEILSPYEDRDPWIWGDLVLDTRGPYDLETLRQGNDFIADVLHLYENLDHADPLPTPELEEAVKPLFVSWQGRASLDAISPEEWKTLLRQARNLTLDQLME